jgi:hypothetical protein
MQKEDILYVNTYHLRVLRQHLPETVGIKEKETTSVFYKD